MKLPFSSLSILLLSIFTYSQSWQTLSIPESPARFDDVFFLNENLGWAADGWGYKVYKTINGGDSWEFQFETEQEYLRNIEFLNENIGFLGTLSSNFYRTTDGGSTWNLISIPGVQAICGLDAVGESTIYGCGAYFDPAYLIKSTDSGLSWEFIDMSAYAESLVEVMFLDELTGFAAGGSSQGGTILKTLDGGTTWTEIYNSNRPGERVWKLQQLFSNPNVYFGAVESFGDFEGKLIKSTDAGQTWMARDVPDTDIQGVGFITENHGWMGGHNTGFLETFDGGETWNNTEFGFSLNRFQIFGENLAYCAGKSIYKFSNMISTNDPELTQHKDLHIEMGPNPTSDKLTISIEFPSPDHLNVTLYDESGKRLETIIRDKITEKGKKNYQISMPSQPGIYFLEFHYNLGAQSKKIIKK
jgi:photosystem II stability/assembly factor-like uncharacterized protein